MTAPDESGINKDCTEKSTDWIATDAKRCTDVPINLLQATLNLHHQQMSAQAHAGCWWGCVRVPLTKIIGLM